MDVFVPTPLNVLVAIAAVAACAASLRRVWVHLLTLRARAWVAPASRWLSQVMGRHEHTFEEIPAADGAPLECVDRRRRGLDALADSLDRRFTRSNAWSASVRGRLSDLRFTDVSRVPFPFANAVRGRLPLCSVAVAASGPRLLTLDGEWTLDVSGSYGVNVAGYDHYRSWIELGWGRVRDLGPVLGPLHPVVATNIDALTRLSGLDEVSFHMSGTEAVMAAARLVRFNTRRRLIVCFAGAYHGWWDGVQPGLGSERAIDDCLTLKDMHPASLAVIRARASEIAAVLVNPVQSFHPNSPPPNDAVMLDSAARSASEAEDRYRAWLHELRATCSKAGVPLVLDEVYTGFRLAPGGAQAYFGVQADMVVYGKTLGGGLPVGVVCGRAELMRRFDPDRPMRMAYVVGTFSAHPAVMGAMAEFLDWVTRADAETRYQSANARCLAWVRAMNAQLVDARLPLRLACLGTIWTLLYTEPSRFNWLLQYYLRNEGVSLSWVGTGRCLSSFDMAGTDYDELGDRLFAAAQAMQRDAWWTTTTEFPNRTRQTRRHLTGDMMRSLIRVPQPIAHFYRDVMQRKHDDHHTSHNDAANQLLHLVSSSIFLACYALAFRNLTVAMWLGVPALLARQFGHAVLEPDVHAAERLLLGYTTRNKSLILLTYLFLPLVVVGMAGNWTWTGFTDAAPTIARYWFWMTMSVVWGRVAVLALRHNVATAFVWLVKLVTDPLTDLLEYRPWRTADGAA